MERSTENTNDGEFELEEVSPSWRQILPRTASDSSLLSAPKSDEDSDEHVDARVAGRLEIFTVDEEKAVVRKLDRRLVLFIAFLYMLSFLDRSSEYKRIYRKIRVLLHTATI